MILFFALLACETPSDDEPLPAPTVTWLTPADGATVDAGDVACSVIIENFTAEDPAKHNEGTAIGYIEIAVDDVVALTTGDTTFTLPLTAGDVTLSAQLFFDDGDEVVTDGTDLCDEGDEGCDPVIATIAVTVSAGP